MKKFVLCLLLFYTSMSFAVTQTPQNLTVILNWFPNPDHTPLIIAQQQGFFKEQGLNVNLIGPENPSDTPQWIANGKGDIGITYEPKFMELVDQGMPLIRVGTLIDKPLNCLVALKDSHIKNLADLKGKDIGTNQNGLSALLLKSMLSKQGMTEKQVSVVNIRYNLTQALLSHQVKAVAGLKRNIEVPLLEMQEQQIVTFFPEDYGVPSYDELIFVSHLKNIHDTRFPRFLAAIKKAVRYIDDHPKESWQQFANRFPESDNPTNIESWFATIPYFAEDPASFNQVEWKKFAEYMHKNALIKQVQRMSRYGVVLEKQA